MNQELTRSPIAFVLELIYEILKGNKRRTVARAIFFIIFKLEKGQYKSYTARKLLSRDYGVNVGAHSYGELFQPGAFSPSVNIGKFVSVARGARVFTQNHPIFEFSTHPYFYESKFGFIENDLLSDSITEIGHDVWIGQYAQILPGCTHVGTGAIIGAGAIVTKPVPDYAIVAGNPAKIIKYRFSNQRISELLASKWWEKSTVELKKRRAEDEAFD